MSDKLRIDFPLKWPVGRPRWTRGRVSGKFRDGRDMISPERAADRVEHEIELLRATAPTLTSDGWGRFKRGGDVGAALYFTVAGKPRVIACDRFDRLGDNMAAMAAHIEALRGQERWGCATLDETFAGHLALPAAMATRPWWEVLGISPDAPMGDIEDAHRRGLLRFHPDRPGGSHDAMAAINRARDEALADRR